MDFPIKEHSRNIALSYPRSGQRGALRRRSFLALALAAVGILVPALAPAQSVRITEIIAANEESFNDDDSDFSDWIEINNSGSAPLDLQGWYLTDDPNDLRQWELPSFQIPADGFRVVFASGKDRADPGAPVHTNFRLDDAGEYVALVHPSGTIVSELNFPRQYSDITYGVGRPAAELDPLITAPAPATAWIPTHGLFDDGWMNPEFEASTWKSGTIGIGYDYGNLIGLDVGEMRNSKASVYARVPFRLESVPELKRLLLRLQYDDGVIAYLNGVEVYRDRAPDDADWNSTATSDRPDSEARSPVEIDITSHLDQLRQGNNVLALHGLNQALDSSDLLIRPELVGVREPEQPEQTGYFLQPTPGSSNPDPIASILTTPRLSEPSQTFQEELIVEATLPETAPSSAVIRYTTDGTAPHRSDARYSGPLVLDTTAQLRMRAFGQNNSESPIVSATYIHLGNDAADFSSNLPLVVVENWGQGRPAQDPKQDAFMAIFESYPDQGGRSRLSQPPHLSTRIGVEVHGSSTAGRPKFSMAFEARNEQGRDTGIRPLGLPEESDWLLWGPYDFDRAMMRNPLIYRLSNQVGRYAVRTRYVEVFFNPDGDSLDQEDYFGVYVLMEDITRDADRVDIEELFEGHRERPGVTGGYMLKIDRPDPGDQGFFVGSQRIHYVDPTEDEIEQPLRDPQEEYIQGFFNQFTESLNSARFRNPIGGYRPYLDVDAAIDHHLLNILAFNVDALRLSTYMAKKRAGSLVYGPIWDFDRSMGSTDRRDANPRVWRAQSGDKGTDFFNYSWWGRLFQDIDFFQRYIDRWHELRQGAFSLKNLYGKIDKMAARLAEAQPRDLDRWGQTPRFGGYDGEIEHLKNWFASRVDFIDSQFVLSPELTPDGGTISPEAQITLNAPGGGTIYYTLNGEDPRRRGGEVAEDARPYMGAISPSESTWITARVQDPNHESLTGPDNPPLTSHWSPPIKARFSLHDSPSKQNLIVSELHYNPVPPSPDSPESSFTAAEFQFIELKNVGSKPIDLTGTRFTEGITYEIGEVAPLESGDVRLLVKSRAAFHARYGSTQKVLGAFQGNLADNGERIRGVDVRSTTVIDFLYRSDWYPTTDGHGFSLTVRDTDSDPIIRQRREGWRPSGASGGSPGSSETTHDNRHSVRITEVVTTGNAPQGDSIELFNPSGSAVNIGGWYLTDDRREPRKFRIPENTLLGAGDYRVFDEAQFRNSEGRYEGFGLDADGEEVFLFAADEEGDLLPEADGFSFGASEAGMSLGSYLTASGQTYGLPQPQSTLGQPNSEFAIGPVLLSEVMYHPSRPKNGSNEVEEYIELTNVSDKAVPLGPESNDALGWQLADGVRYAFRPGLTLAPGEQVVVVGFDPYTEQVALRRFRRKYGLDENGAMIVGPYDGQLDDEGEAVRLLRPGAGLENAIEADGVDYGHESPWPQQANGHGPALHRLFLDKVGYDPLHWIAGTPTPGTLARPEPERDRDNDQLPDRWETVYGLNPHSANGMAGSAGDPDMDGRSNRQEYEAGTHPYDRHDLLTISSIQHRQDDIRLRFEAVPGRAYKLEQRLNIDSTSWTSIGETIHVGQRQVVTIAAPAPSNSAASSRFYRIRVESTSKP